MSRTGTTPTPGTPGIMTRSMTGTRTMNDDAASTVATQPTSTTTNPATRTNGPAQIGTTRTGVAPLTTTARANTNVQQPGAAVAATVQIPTQTTITTSSSTSGPSMASTNITMGTNPTTTSGPVTTTNDDALTTMLQQLLATVGQIGLRLTNLEAARTAATLQQAGEAAAGQAARTGPPTTTYTGPTTAASAPPVMPMRMEPPVAQATTTAATVERPPQQQLVMNAEQTTAAPAATTVTVAPAPATAAAPTRATSSRNARRRRAYDPPDDPSSSSSKYDRSSGDDERRYRRSRRHSRRTDDGDGDTRRRTRKKNAKESDLQSFKPTAGGVRVETWTTKVDLAVEGARISGRGTWTDQELYYVVGNKLDYGTAKHWVQINKELVEPDKTWTKLKEALVRRYGERPDLAMAEWRVMQRMMEPGESYADFASGLRDAAGQNPVREETLLAQFYRGLQNMTRQMVQLEPAPTTLGEAVDKATKISGPSYNIARGMRNIGQPWVTSTEQRAAVQVDGMTGYMRVIPGIGNVPTESGGVPVTGTAVAEDEAYFTNPQGVFNEVSNVWVRPAGRTWNGKFWQLTGKERSRKKAAAHDQRKRASGKKAKTMMTVGVDESSDEEAEEPPPAKRKRAPVRKVAPAAKPVKEEREDKRTEQPDSRFLLAESKCYACGALGHFARNCPDDGARQRNNAYLSTRTVSSTAPAENEKRA